MHKAYGAILFPQVVTLDEEVVSVGASAVIHVHDGPVDRGQPLDHHGGQLLLDELELVVEGGLGRGRP